MHRTKWPSSLHDEPYQDDGPGFTHGDGDMEQFAILGCKAEVRQLLLCNLKEPFEYNLLFNLVDLQDLVDISLTAGGDGEHLVATMSSM